jgi:general nucleoside transport system permease protein
MIKREYISSVLLIVSIIILMLIVSTILILVSGYKPLVAFGGLLEYSFGDFNAFSNVLNRAMSLILAGLAVSVAFKAGFYNLGVEGQIFLGAMAAAIIGYKITVLPSALHIPLLFAAGLAAGAAGAFIPGLLKTRFNVDEVITTIMLNSIYVLFTGYLATYPFRDPERWSGTTPPVSEAAQLPMLSSLSSLSSGILISIGIAVLLYFIFKRADIGFKWKMTGLNPVFSRYGGIKVANVQLNAAVISGALAGLTGALLVSGTQHRFWMEIGTNIGWDGVLIGMLALYNPLAVVASGLVFAVLKTGAVGMEINSQVPSELINITLAILILVVTGRGVLSSWISRYVKPSEKMRR